MVTSSTFSLVSFIQLVHLIVQKEKLFSSCYISFALFHTHSLERRKCHIFHNGIQFHCKPYPTFSYQDKQEGTQFQPIFNHLKPSSKLLHKNLIDKHHTLYPNRLSDCCLKLTNQTTKNEQNYDYLIPIPNKIFKKSWHFLHHLHTLLPEALH